MTKHTADDRIPQMERYRNDTDDDELMMMMKTTMIMKLMVTMILMLIMVVMTCTMTSVVLITVDLLQSVGVDCSVNVVRSERVADRARP